MPLQQDVPLLKVFYEMSHRACILEEVQPIFEREVLMPFMAGCQNWWLPGKKCESQFFCASHFNVLCDKFINVNISEWSSHLLGHWRHDREPILQLSRKWSSMPCINLQNSGISLGERCIIIWWKRVCGCSQFNFFIFT